MQILKILATFATIQATFDYNKSGSRFIVYFSKVLLSLLGVHLNAFKLQLAQYLQVNDCSKRTKFADEILDRICVDSSYLNHICFSDVPTFPVYGIAIMSESGVQKISMFIWRCNETAIK